MEAFVFIITLPTDWSQLTDKQLTFLFEQLSKSRPAYDVETRCLLKWAQLVILDQLPDGSFLVRRRSHHPRIPFRKKLPPVVLSASQVFAATRTLAWIEQVPSNPIRISRIGRHRALPADFMEVTFEKYLYCDNLYQGYLQTKSEDILKELAQVLYDSEHLRPNTAQRIGVFYWFASLKAFFARKFHHFLQPVSTESANLLGSTPIQQRVNPTGNGLTRAGFVFRKGDRVLQLKNDYTKEVFNGDIGLITAVNMEDRTLTVGFDGKAVEYESTELDELSLAYATTIHKSQGSEYPIVVIPVHFTNYVMLQRNLIYTAVTRAKKVCIVIGQKHALWYAVSHVTVTQRNTKLKERLQGKTVPMTYTHHDEETLTDMAAEDHPNIK